MSKKDFFMLPFDEGTQIKLRLFEEYFKAWLHLFIMSKFNKPIRVFDFFSGSGFDSNNEPGSPIRIVDILTSSKFVKDSNKEIWLYFNDKDNNKIEYLRSHIIKRIEDAGLSSKIKLKFSSLIFSESLNRYQEDLKNGCNLLFIDQFGIKEVNEVVFQNLIRLPETDFVFFISSEYIRRFASTKVIKRLHPKFDFDKIAESDRRFAHEIISNEFRKYVPGDIRSYSIIPFSILKRTSHNIYGLVFVTKHIRGAEKFLEAAWKINVVNGTANYDIDEEFKKNQIDLFDSSPKLDKIQKFQTQLEQEIDNGNLRTNKDVYEYTVNSGHICRHAQSVLMKMKISKIISFDSPAPLLNYDIIFKKHRILEFKKQ